MSLSKDEKTVALLARANDDRVTLELSGLTDFPFGQHAQAAIEKYFKALLNDLTGEYPRIHDLQQLRALLIKAGETLPESDISLSLLSLYASRFRYDDDADISALDRQKCLAAVETIRDFVEMRIKQLNS